MVARFVAHLTAAGTLDSTYIIFSSDHGYHLGEFGMLYDKRMLYETDIRVPLFVAGPGIEPGQVIEAPAAHIDLAPTILSMAGISTPPQMDGRSWLPLVLDTAKQVEWRTAFMVEYSGGGIPETEEDHMTDNEEAVWEDKHWHYSFTSDEVTPRKPALCGANASDELSIWGKCSCTVDGAWRVGQPEVHDTSPCDSANNSYACVRTLDVGKANHRRGSANPITQSDVGGNYSANWIYCEFSDSENFKEYYDLNSDPYNLHNLYYKLDASHQGQLRELLALHRACKGAECFKPR